MARPVLDGRKVLLSSIEDSQAEKYKQNLLDGLLLFHGVAPCKPLDMDRRVIDIYDESQIEEHTTSYYYDEITRLLPHLSKMLGMSQELNRYKGTLVILPLIFGSIL